jgi:hypothetical protein
MRREEVRLREIGIVCAILPVASSETLYDRVRQWTIRGRIADEVVSILQGTIKDCRSVLPQCAPRGGNSSTKRLLMSLSA